MGKQDGRLTARNNETRVLRALHRFGWLRAKDLAALVWLNWWQSPAGDPSLCPAKATASGLRMAQYTLRRLVQARQVLRGHGPDGSVLYALAEAGARRLQAIGVPASTGKDLVRQFSAAQFQHRAAANAIAIGGIIEGFRVATEREIAQGRWLGGEDGISGKKPDVLLQGDGRVWWVEVERSRKNAKDYAKLLRWITTVGNDTRRPSGPSLLGDGLRWAKVVFFCTPGFRAKLRRDLAAVGWKPEMVEAFVIFKETLYNIEGITWA